MAIKNDIDDLNSKIYILKAERAQKEPIIQAVFLVLISLKKEII